jgi:hypothetical protein
MTGIVLCFFALFTILASLVLYVLPSKASAGMPVIKQKLLDWGFWLIVTAALLVVALLWGNVGVIYSHAGFTG